jgi:DNA-binding HxlR family transcriptional regulator
MTRPSDGAIVYIAYGAYTPFPAVQKNRLQEHIAPQVHVRSASPRGACTSFKESAAISQLPGLLESRYAIRVLWVLRDGHAQTFRLLQDSMGGITPNTLNTHIKELREAGLVNQGSDGYIVTPVGSDLLKRMNDLPRHSPPNGWRARAKKINERSLRLASRNPQRRQRL